MNAKVKHSSKFNWGGRGGELKKNSTRATSSTPDGMYGSQMNMVIASRLEWGFVLGKVALKKNLNN